MRLSFEGADALIGTLDLDKVGQEIALDEVRVELGDTIDLVRADDGEEGHADLLRVALLDQADLGELAAVVRVLLLDRLEPEDCGPAREDIHRDLLAHARLMSKMICM